MYRYYTRYYNNFNKYDNIQYRGENEGEPNFSVMVFDEALMLAGKKEDDWVFWKIELEKPLEYVDVAQVPRMPIWDSVTAWLDSVEDYFCDKAEKPLEITTEDYVLGVSLYRYYHFLRESKKLIKEDLVDDFEFMINSVDIKGVLDDR